MQRLKQWELKRAIYEKKALAKPETAKQGPNCIVSQMEVSLLKWAQTANGCMGLLQQGRPQPISISTPTTWRLVHKLRADVDAILVGAGTWKADHPQLNVRAWYGPDPERILISAHATQAPEGFWLAHSTNEVVSHLNEEGKQSLLVEGGAHTLQSFIAAELWDVTRMRMTSSGGAVASPAQPPCFHSSIF